MSRRADQLNRVEAAIGRLEAAAARIEDAVNPATPGGIAVAAADAKAARSSGEAAFAGVQALASVATVKPGPAELAAAIKAAGEKVGEMHAMIKAAVAPPVSMPRSPDPATTMTPVAKAPRS